MVTFPAQYYCFDFLTVTGENFPRDHSSVDSAVISALAVSWEMCEAGLLELCVLERGIKECGSAFLQSVFAGSW